MSSPLNLSNVRLVSVESRRHWPAELAARAIREALGIQASIEFEPPQTMRGPKEGAVPDPGTANAYFVPAVLAIEAKLRDDTEAELPEGLASVMWFAKVELELEYQLPVGEVGWPTDEAIQMIAPNFQIHAWPYFREIITSLAMRAGVPVPSLPLLTADMFEGE